MWGKKSIIIFIRPFLRKILFYKKLLQFAKTLTHFYKIPCQEKIKVWATNLNDFLLNKFWIVFFCIGPYEYTHRFIRKFSPKFSTSFTDFCNWNPRILRLDFFTIFIQEYKVSRHGLLWLTFFPFNRFPFPFAFFSRFLFCGFSFFCWFPFCCFFLGTFGTSRFSKKFKYFIFSVGKLVISGF